MKKLLHSIVAVLMTATLSHAYTAPPGSLMDQGVHPRVFIAPGDWDELRARSGIAGYEAYENFDYYGAEYTILKDHVDNLVTTTDPASAVLGHNMAAIAFVYNATTSSSYLTQLKEHFDLVRAQVTARAITANWNDRGYYNLAMGDVNLSRTTRGMGIALDWVWNDLTLSEQTDYADAMMYMICQCFRGEWRHSDYNNRILRHHTNVFAGIALYGESLEDGLVDYIFDGWDNQSGVLVPISPSEDYENTQGLVSLFYDNLIPARRQAVGGGWGEGWSYWAAEEAFFPTSLEAYEIAAGAASSWDSTFDYARYAGKYHAYLKRPDGKVLKSGDTDVHEIDSSGYISQVWNYFIWADKYDDPYMQTIANNADYQYDSYYWYPIVFGDPDQPATAVLNSNHDLSYKFTGIGTWVMREGFEDVNDMYVSFKASAYWAGHGFHGDNGSFIIFKNGDTLANDGGRYSLKSNHDDRFQKNTVAHNSLLIYDPDETDTVWGSPNNWLYMLNTGGQLSHKNDSRTRYVLTEGSPWDLVDIKADIIAPDTDNKYDYIRADITDSYESTKLSLAEREFLWVRGENNYVIIFDRVVSTDASFKKTWLLNTNFEPDINGSWSTGTENAYGGTSGRDSTNSDLVTVAGLNSKLYVKSLLPTSKTITKIGGPDPTNEYNRDDQNNGGDSFEFYAFGTLRNESYDLEEVAEQWDYSSSNLASLDYDEGWGRIEISPTAENLSDTFLNVLYPADSTDAVPTITTLTATNMTGAFIADSTAPVIALFSNTTSLIGATAYNITATGTVKHVVTNLVADTYSVTQGGTEIATPTVADDGTMYFSSTNGGAFVITGGEEPPQQPETTWSWQFTTD